MRKLFVVWMFAAFCGLDVFADNVNFKWVKDINYEQVRHFSNSYSAFKQDGKWGYMNNKAVVAILPRYEECKDFSNGYAAVKMGGMWGYINKMGSMMITPQFDEVNDFNEDGLAIVKKDGKYGVINTSGSCPAGIIFDEIGRYSDGYALAKAGGVQYYIDAYGKIKNIDGRYHVENFSNGLAPMQNIKTGKWGFVDKKGNLAIETKYDTVYSFSNNIALVKYHNEYRYIRRNGGEKKIESATGQQLEFVNGYAKIKTARGVGFIGKDFKLLPIMGKSASNFNKSGLAALELENGDLCYIDGAGKIVFKASYDRIGNFNNGLAWVCKNDKYGYIDKKGNLVIDTVFTSATDFKDSLAYVSTKERFGCIRFAPGSSMPYVEFTEVTLKDSNSNGKVEAEEEFDIEVTVKNPGFSNIKDLQIRFVNQVDQEQWFVYDTQDVSIPMLGGQRDTTIVFSGKSDLSILSSDVGMRFVTKAGNSLTQNEHTWSFETVGIKACKPVVTRYWIYRDDHGSISPGKVNLLMTIKNEGKDPARDVNVDLQLPDGVKSENPTMVIANLQPGESRDISTVFHIDESIVNEQTIMARISDISQQHNKVEFLSYTVGRPGMEIRLDGSAPVFNIAQNVSTAAMTGAQMVASQTEGVGKDVFVSELLADIQKIATPDDSKYAVIYGNEDYNRWSVGTVEQPDVEYAEADAQAFKQYCINYMGVREDHILYLANGTKSQMLKQFSYLKDWSKSKEGDMELYVFYAGHGQPDDEGKSTYLIPTDVSLSDPTSGIKLDDFYALIGNINARKKIIFLDACYSGQGRAGWIEVKQPVTTGNMLIFTSSSSVQKSMPYKAKHHGLFTYYLLNAIKQSNGQITINDLFIKTKDDVMHNSVYVNQSIQTPELIPGHGIDKDWKKWKLY